MADYNSSLLWAITPERVIVELLDSATQLRVALEKLPDRRVDAAAFEATREKVPFNLRSASC